MLREALIVGGQVHDLDSGLLNDTV
jgi:hypothetical protein